MQIWSTGSAARSLRSAFDVARQTETRIKSKQKVEYDERLIANLNISRVFRVSLVCVVCSEPTSTTGVQKCNWFAPNRNILKTTVSDPLPTDSFATKDQIPTLNSCHSRQNVRLRRTQHQWGTVVWVRGPAALRPPSRQRHSHQETLRGKSDQNLERTRLVSPKPSPLLLWPFCQMVFEGSNCAHPFQARTQQ